jgi:serine/threonine protein phosphatase PrpC
MTLPSRTEPTGVVVVDDHAASRSGAVRFAGASHPGLVRERNEDRLHVDAGRGLLIVVDGMGGEAAGEVAAEIAFANNEIARLAREHSEWQGMGCVLTLALIDKGVVTVGHVGDSRLYRLHGGRLDKLTHDHSPVGAREERGELPERDAMRHPRRNEVYRSLGAAPHGPHDADFIELLRFPLGREDAVLICSDGLTDLVPANEIERVVREHAGDERTLVQALVDTANAAGGKDNVTVAFAAGDRFAETFVRPGAARRTPAGRADARVSTRPGFWRRGSTLFALGALTGLTVFGGIQLLEHRLSQPVPAGPATSAVPVAARHEVGPGARFHTIGDALAAARAGDTIAVHPGRYREQVRLEDGVTLLATPPGGAMIEPAAPADGAGPVAALVAEGIGAGRVSGFVIAGAPDAPIDYGLVLRRSAVTVENVEVRGARVAGVAIEDAGGAALVASRIHDNPGAGIIVRGIGAPLVLHNRVIDNGHGNPPAPGIDVVSPARPRIAGNQIVGNGGEAVRGLPAHSPLLEANQLEGPVVAHRARGAAR